MTYSKQHPYGYTNSQNLNVYDITKLLEIMIRFTPSPDVFVLKKEYYLLEKEKLNVIVRIL